GRRGRRRPPRAVRAHRRPLRGSRPRRDPGRPPARRRLAPALRRRAVGGAGAAVIPARSRTRAVVPALPALPVLPVLAVLAVLAPAACAAEHAGARAGTAAPPGPVPGDVLDLARWKLQLPIGEAEKPIEIAQPTTSPARGRTSSPARSTTAPATSS